MLVFILVVYKNNIKVNNNNFANKIFKHIIHHSHGSVVCIKKAKWYNHPFKKAIPHFEGYFPFIVNSHPDLLVATYEINL